MLNPYAQDKKQKPTKTTTRKIGGKYCHVIQERSSKFELSEVEVPDAPGTTEIASVPNYRGEATAQTSWVSPYVIRGLVTSLKTGRSSSFAWKWRSVFSIFGSKDAAGNIFEFFPHKLDVFS